MKKSKVILAIALAVVLLITIISVPTFSWFTRPQSLTGSSMALSSKNNYRAYNGNNVSLATYSSSDGITYSSNALNNTGANNATVCSGTVTAGNRDFYRTTITNSSASEQTVSLYANVVHTSTTETALGVNDPTRSYRDFTLKGGGSGTLADYGFRRIYFERPSKWDDEDGDWSLWTTGGNYEVDYWDANSVHGYSPLTCEGTDYSHYHADIPYSATGCFIKIRGSSIDKQRTENVDLTMFSTQYSYLISAWHERNGYNNVKVQWKNDIYGANFAQKYSQITIDPGSTFNAKLSWPIVQGAVTYSSSDTGVFSVNSNGVITAVSNGTATLTTTATSDSYHDSVSVTSTVTVGIKPLGYDIKEVPIVQNIRIPGARQDSTDNIVNVDWYVINNSSSSMTYTIDQLYLGM